MAGAHRRCHRCGDRFAQDPGGLCRRCGRELGLFTQTTREEETGRIEKRARRIAGAGAIAFEDLLPRPNILITIDGIDYEVTWNGS